MVRFVLSATEWGQIQVPVPISADVAPPRLPPSTTDKPANEPNSKRRGGGAVAGQVLYSCAEVGPAGGPSESSGDRPDAAITLWRLFTITTALCLCVERAASLRARPMPFADLALTIMPAPIGW